jgi:hypothetical protein
MGMLLTSPAGKPIWLLTRACVNKGEISTTQIEAVLDGSWMASLPKSNKQNAARLQ